MFFIKLFVYLFIFHIMGFWGLQELINYEKKKTDQGKDWWPNKQKTQFKQMQ